MGTGIDVNRFMQMDPGRSPLNDAFKKYKLSPVCGDYLIKEGLDKLVAWLLSELSYRRMCLLTEMVVNEYGCYGKWRVTKHVY